MSISNADSYGPRPGDAQVGAQGFVSNHLPLTPGAGNPHVRMVFRLHLGRRWTGQRMLTLEPVIIIIKINMTLHLQLFKYPTFDTFKWNVQMAGSGFIPLAYNGFIWQPRKQYCNKSPKVLCA